jgi:hypothetical protein
MRPGAESNRLGHDQLARVDAKNVGSERFGIRLRDAEHAGRQLDPRQCVGVFGPALHPPQRH